MFRRVVEKQRKSSCRVGGGLSGRWRGWLIGVLLCGVLCAGVVGCAGMKDGRGAPSESFTTPERNFGEEIYNFLLREARYHPKLSVQRVRAVENAHRKWNVIGTVNAMVPKAMLSPLEGFLRSLLPFYDDNTLSKITKDTALSLNDLAGRQDVLQALLLADQRVGMTPILQKGDGSLIHRMLSFPKQSELLSKLMTWLRDHDGYLDDATTPNPNEKRLLSDVLGSMADFLLRTNRRKPSQFPDLITDMLFTEDASLALGTGVRCAVRFDAAGNPITTAIGKSQPKPLPAPFGLPGGKRGSCGEARVGNEAIYDIRDLSRTILGALLWDARRLVTRDLPLKDGKIPFPFNATVGVRPLLEPLDAATKGFSAQSPLLQAVRAVFPLMKGPRFYKVLRGLSRVSAKEQNELAAQLAMMKEISDLAKGYPNAVMRDGNTMFEDMLPILQELLASPGFLGDLLKALQTPGLTDALKKGLVDMLRYRKKRITLQDYETHKKGQRAAVFSESVQHNQPDQVGNISLMQRMLHLLANVNRFAYKSKLKSAAGINIPLIEMRIDNLALMYLRAVIGKVSVWETIYVSGSPITDGFLKDTLKKSLPVMGLSEKPNPEELGLFLNKELIFHDVPLVAGLKLTITLDPIMDRQGYKVREHHADSLLAALASGTVAATGGALRPVAEVFDKHGKLQRLLDLFVIMSRHWASNGNKELAKDGKPSYPEPRTNLRSYEPILIDAVEKAQMLERLDSMGAILDKLTLGDAPGAEKAMPSLQNYIAFVVGKPGTKYADTPLGRLLDAIQSMDKALQGPAKANARQSWEEATSALSDLLLQVEGKGAQARFKNKRAPAVLATALKFLADRAEKREAVGEWGPILGQIQRDLEETLTDPIMPSLLDLLDNLTQNRPLLSLTTEMLSHTMPDPDKDPRQFGELMIIAAGLLSPTPDDIRVPIARYLGTTLKTREALVRRLVIFLHKSIPLDKQNVLLKVIQNSATAHPTQNSLLYGVFPDLFSGISRLQPGQEQPLTVDDLKAILNTTARYLTDEKKGMEKLYTIVKSRNGTPAN